MSRRVICTLAVIVSTLAGTAPEAAAGLPGLDVALDAAGAGHSEPAEPATTETADDTTADEDDTGADDEVVGERNNDGTTEDGGSAEADGPDATHLHTGPDADEPERGMADVPGIGTEAPGAEHLGLVWRIFTATPGTTSKGNAKLSDCPDAATCDAFRTGKARWATTEGVATMRYRYSDAGRPEGRAPSEGVVRSQLTAAAAEWNRWNPSTVFVDAGDTDAPFNATGPDGSCDDGVNVVTWRYLDPEALGATAICYDTRTYEIHDVDTALNAAYHWDVFDAPSPDATAYDLRSILTHELGHWLSLFDLKMRLRDDAQTMYASAAPGEIRKRTLALGDVLGSRAAYPCGTACPDRSVISD